MAGLYLCVLLALYFWQERLLFIPLKYSNNEKIELATSNDEIFIDAPEGGRLHGIYLQVAEAKGSILYFHGNTGSMRRWAYMAEELTSYGYNVLVMDYRGYGKSKGRRSEALMHIDAKAALNWLRQKGQRLPLVVYGRSLGSGFAVKLAAEEVVDSLVLETPYFSMDDIGQKRFPFLPIRWLSRFHLRSDLYIRKVKCPILMFQGTKDRIVPYKSALKLYNVVADRNDCHLVTLVGGKHNNLNTYPLFRESLMNFLS